MDINTTFQTNYEVTILEELPQPETIRHYFYPGASMAGGRDGLIVRVDPNARESWIGTFAFGQIAPTGPSGVFATPDPDRMCVVSRGMGNFVSAHSPLQCEEVNCYPIIDVRPIHTQGIIVFAEFTRLVAYGPAGLKWKTKRLSWDNLKIIEVTNTSIKGEFWDICSEATASFVVDLATGTHQGGIKEY
jgi:hypothetical protein